MSKHGTCRVSSRCVFGLMQWCQLGLIEYQRDDDIIATLQELFAIIMSKIMGKTSSGDKHEYQAMIPHRDVWPILSAFGSESACKVPKYTEIDMNL